MKRLALATSVLAVSATGALASDMNGVIGGGQLGKGGAHNSRALASLG
jgi:hypothetical protein